MSKVTYLNSHLDKFRPKKGPPKITIKYEDIDGIFHTGGRFGMTKEVQKILIKSFKDKKDFREVQQLISNKIDKVLLYSLITLYWTAFNIYYYNEQFEDLISDCLNAIDENMPLLESPRYCRKVYYYINSLEEIK